jgi:hypothetical protein
VQPLWRKLLFGLMVVALAMPMTAMTAGAASADRLTVRITAPAEGAKVSGFTNFSFIINPRGQVGVPARREDTPYRAYSFSYARGADVRDDGAFSVWRIDGGTTSFRAGAAAGARDNRNAYVQPGVGSIRPPRAGGFPWDTTLVPDGPATIRVRGFGYDGSFKDDYRNVVVENAGVSPDYVSMSAPKNGDTVSGWVPIVFTAMPQWQGIQRGVRGSRYTTYLPTCLDTDLFYAKVEYAQGSSPTDSDLILWWYNSFSGQTRIKEQIPQDGKVQLSFTGCDSMYINNGGTNWDSTVVPDGPATIRVTVVFTEGTYRTFERVVNVENKGKGVQYFGIDKSAITGPISGEGWGLPGYATVPQRGVPRWTYELPIAYYACDIASGDVTGSPGEANWTMYWVNDNLTWNEVRTTDGWTIGGDTRLPDWSYPGYGRSGGLCRLDTTALANGTYTVQLRLQLTNGTAQRDWVVVQVRN